VVLGAPQTGLIGTRHTAVVIGNTIYHIKRSVVVGEGGVTTENHTGGSAGAGSRVVDHKAGHLALEGVGEGNTTATGKFFRFHVLHGITEGLLFTGDTESGNNYLVQEFAVFAEGYVNGLTIEHNLYGLIADAAHHEGGAVRHIVECKGTIHIGDSTVVGSGYNYASTYDRADVVNDNTLGRTVLSRSHPGHGDQDDHQ
jgi:hypothetical protein